jgi:hypothetical protein
MLDRGLAGDQSNKGGVIVQGPIKNNGGTVEIFPGDRLDISGQDSKGNAYYQTGTSATTTIYATTTSGATDFVGTIVTTSDASMRATNGVYGNIRVR